MPDPERWRLFVSLEIPEAVKQKIEHAQAELRRVLPGRGIRWAKREQFHLTLRFLGDVDATRVPALEESLRGACRGLGALPLRAEQVGFFPDARRPRVVWVGVSDEAGQLERLQQAVEAATSGFTTEEKEGRFSAHVTLARIKGIKRAEADVLAQAAAGMASRFFGEWTVAQIELMRSELLPEGARHGRVAGVALGATAV